MLSLGVPASHRTTEAWDCGREVQTMQARGQTGRSSSVLCLVLGTVLSGRPGDNWDLSVCWV